MKTPPAPATEEPVQQDRPIYHPDFPDKMKIEWWPIDRLKPYPGNARKISPEAVTKVARSIRMYGWVQPIVVEPDGTIVIGHVRRLAAIENGDELVPVHVAKDLSPEQLRALRIADNRLHQETDWDAALLKEEFMKFDEANLDIPGMTGFNEE
jgi:ParB-like chromosome segregation protein Spo0J